MKKSSLLFLLVPLALIVFAAPAEAQTSFGVRAGMTDDEPMLGVEMLVPITRDIMFNPSIEATSEIITGNLDAHYDFNIDTRTSFWLGGGLAFVKPDEGDSDVGINVLGGVGRRWNNVYPYAQVRLTTGANDDDFGSIMVGVRF